MGWIQRTAAALGLARSTGDTATAGAGVMPPPRSTSALYVSADEAVTLSDVYRGLQVISTAVAQLRVQHYRGNDLVTPAHPLVRKPCTDLSARVFWEQTTLDLATCGNAYWRKLRGPLSGQLVELRLLRPDEMHVAIDRRTDRPVYWHRGEQLTRDEVVHLRLFPRTGYPLGLGPIQAAQIELRGTIEARDYSSTFLSTTDIPNGVLTTDQALTADDAKRYKAIWRGDGDPAGPHGHTVRVLGQGLKYNPLQLKPADVQFLETRKFNKTQLASLLGIPSSLLLAAVEGTSQTYANVEQEWIAFARFTLMQYVGAIEDALTELLPYGNDARFDLDRLLRTDTKTRYEAHAIAISAGFKTPDEVRTDEGLPALSAASNPTPTPTLEGAA